MDHVLCLQTSAGRDLGIASRTTSQLAALGQDLWATSAVDGAIHAATTQQRAIGCVDDGLRILLGNVPLN